MIVFNVLALAICWRFAYIGDIEDKERQNYYNYLEQKVELQNNLIDMYKKYIFGHK